MSWKFVIYLKFIQIIENISKLPNVGREALAALISLISSFTERIETGVDFWLAVMSLPWLQTMVLFLFYLYK